ncbi:hypothetical protein FDECE_8646 [Fusarium decemcellulare]|nr:hypothetical protein FDECE_8646 [Fusarium decemcellulare]
MDQAHQPRAGRKRTFTGCRTCRNRHVKCDDAHPECGPCRQMGLACGGYWAPLLWITEGMTSQPKERQSRRGFEYRYPVLSDAQRRQMSGEISQSLGSRSASEHIARLEASCYRLQNRGGAIPDLFRGPFGVFPVHQQEPYAAPSSPKPNDLVNVDLQPGQDKESNVVEQSTQWSQWCPDFEAADPDDFLHSLDAEINLDQWTGSNQVGEPLFDPLLTDSLLDLTGQNLHYMDSDLSFGVPNDDLTNSQRHNVVASPPRLPSPSIPIFASDLTPTEQPILPAHSEPLLRHYKQEIYESGLYQSKRDSPWRLIFFPCALETFAELSLWRSTSQTRFALLYGLLALSAFRLHIKGESDFRGYSWHDIGVQYQKQAQSHLRAALKTEMTGAGQAKYKELLMAILAISMISLSKGGSSSQVFLLDAERFIRRQGLVDDIPFEFRLLHHMYSHLRVLAEGIGACLETPTDDPTRGYNEPPEKDGKFCLAEECYDVGLDPAEEKSPDVGFTDIHLQVQGQWNKTLFPSIYGFPESLWTLLSQTVATVNEKARIESLDPPNRALTDALTHHIRNLEQTIWAWTLTSDLIGPPRPDHRGSSENQDQLAESLAQGLHQALILYFYRRMFNLSPMLLQDVVGRALDHLERCVTHVKDQDLGMCIAWATLTTACEAITPALQEKALKILRWSPSYGSSAGSRETKAYVGDAI